MQIRSFPPCKKSNRVCRERSTQQRVRQHVRVVTAPVLCYDPSVQLTIALFRVGTIGIGCPGPMTARSIKGDCSTINVHLGFTIQELRFVGKLDLSLR